MPVGGTSLALPCFFPSISSVKSNLPSIEYLRVLLAVDYPQFLVSAYDVYNSPSDEHSSFIDLLSKATDGNSAVLLDSGNYESYWKQDAAWDHGRFWSVLEVVPHHLAFCYDNQDPIGGVREITQEIESAVLRDKDHSRQGTVLPIVHAPTELLPDVVVEVATRLQPIMLAVPERRLGEGILARAESVASIRNALDKVESECALHLLGTGNPISLLIYIIAGANSFDGLEWCQTTVDHETGLLYHFQQRELFKIQPVAATLPDLPYVSLTLAHNLRFYRTFMIQIQEALSGGTLLEFAQNYIPAPFLHALTTRLAQIS
ncbi:MAG TPA: hypothetical protein VF914_01590 [Chloroflexia bacterium]